jgi:hypothetical protein
MRLIYFLILSLAFNVSAAETFEIVIREHKFVPKIIEVPADKKIKLIVRNEDDSAEEFESFDLKREKIVPGKSSIVINLGQLKRGEYSFFGEFHHKTAQGKLIVK